MRFCSCPATTGSESSRRPTRARSRWRLWALLGPKPVTMLAWESFGAGWVTDVLKQLKLEAEVRTADYGEICRPQRHRPGERHRLHLERHDQRRPRARTATGSPTTAPASRSATRPQRHSPSASTGRRSMSAPSAGRRRSAAKAGTACSCSARARSSGWSRQQANRPLPKIFRLTKSGALIEGVFKGETINTPSMLAVEDWLVALDWAERVGGLDALIARADANAAALDRWVQRSRTGSSISPAIPRSVRTPRSACSSPTARTKRRTRRGRRRS